MTADYCAYFDESYSHAAMPLVYTIAGYVSVNGERKKFRNE